MPYIPQDRRDIIDNLNDPLTKGELNYLITKLMIKYVNNFGRSYSNIRTLTVKIVTDMQVNVR